MSLPHKYKLKAKVWVYPGDAVWHFVTINKKVSGELKGRFGKNARGFGSLPVEVKLGDTEWKTSIFPDSKSGTYLLPIKAKVRHAEGVFEGEETSFSIKIKV